MLRFTWFAVADAMFSTGPDDDGMREWVILSLLIFGLLHLIHHITLLALTGLQPPMCLLINGLNRPPTMELERGGVCAYVWRGRKMGRSHDCSFRPLLKGVLCPSD